MTDPCPHPADRLYTWLAYGNAGLDSLCVYCCGCGAILQNTAPQPRSVATVTPGPDAAAAIDALRLAQGIVRTANLNAPTASECERSDTFARFCDWWNFIALPALTGEPAPDWAALRIELIRQHASPIEGVVR